MADKLITLEHFGNATEAHAARLELDAAGIRAVVGDDAAAEMLSIMGAGLGGVKLLVFERDADRARGILRRRRKNEGPRVPAWICQECGSVVDAGFEVCWSCGASYDPQRSQPAPPATDEEDENAADEQASVDEAVGNRPTEDDEARRTRANAPPLAEGEWRCPTCGMRVDRPHERCPACGAGPDDPPNPYLAAETESAAPRPAEKDRAAPDTARLVLFAFRASILGLVVCPGLMHWYSLWLLLRVGMRGEDLPPQVNRQFYAALAIDLLFGLLLFPYILLMMSKILVNPLS